MTIIGPILEYVGGLAGLAAIFCLCVHIGGEMYEGWKSNFEKLFRLDNWAWAGLLFLAIYMACQIGRIGL